MTDPTDNTESDTGRELASLKQEFDDLRQTVNDLRAERQQTRKQLYQTLRGLGFSGEEIESNVRGLMDHGLTRRAAMLALVGAVGGASFMTGRASAAASTSDSDGDIGTPSNRVDVFADGIDGNSATFTGSVDAGTITTADAFNSEIGDNVDYIDPVWLAESGVIYAVDSLESLDAYKQQTSGSGTVVTATNGFDLQTGTTSGSLAAVNGSLQNAGTSWDKRRIISIAVSMYEDSGNRTDHYTTGRVQEGKTGFGFRFESDGTWTGVVHDGTSETTTTLSTGNSFTSFTAFELKAVYEPGTDVIFYIDGTQEGTIGSGLPSGTGGDESNSFDAVVENSTGANRRTIIQSAKVVQAP